MEEALKDRRMREAVRYLGYGKHKPDEITEKLLEESFQELDSAVRVRSCWRVFDLAMREDGRFLIEGYEFASRSLYRNLAGCTKIAVLGITLGAGVDLLMHRYEVSDMARAVVLQSAAAAYLEAECDTLQERIRTKASESGLWLRPRFSPGYGDFDLAYQKQVMELLDLPRKAGITMTDTFMMAPVKSVTAFIGMSREYSGCVPEGCEACGKKDCRYRRGVS